MPKTLLQTIFTAFCAILCTTSMGGGGMRNLAMRAAMFGGSNSSPYRVVNYIQGNAVDFELGAYVDLGFYPAYNFAFDADVGFVHNMAHYETAFGGRNSSGVYDFQLSQTSEGTTTMLFRGGSSGSNQFSQTGSLFPEAISKYTFSASGAYSLAGGLYTGTITRLLSGASSYTLSLFAVHDYVSGIGERFAQRSNFKIGACKFWNGSVLERDLTPVVRNSDEVAGFLDAVSGNFFTSAVSAYPLRYG